MRLELFLPIVALAGLLMMGSGCSKTENRDPKNSNAAGARSNAAKAAIENSISRWKQVRFPGSYGSEIRGYELYQFGDQVFVSTGGKAGSRIWRLTDGEAHAVNFHDGSLLEFPRLQSICAQFPVFKAQYEEGVLAAWFVIRSDKAFRLNLSGKELSALHASAFVSAGQLFMYLGPDIGAKEPELLYLDSDRLMPVKFDQPMKSPEIAWIQPGPARDGKPVLKLMSEPEPYWMMRRQFTFENGLATEMTIPKSPDGWSEEKAGRLTWRSVTTNEGELVLAFTVTNEGGGVWLTKDGASSWVLFDGKPLESGLRGLIASKDQVFKTNGSVWLITEHQGAKGNFNRIWTLTGNRATSIPATASDKRAVTGVAVGDDSYVLLAPVPGSGKDAEPAALYRMRGGECSPIGFARSTEDFGPNYVTLIECGSKPVVLGDEMVGNREVAMLVWQLEGESLKKFRVALSGESGPAQFWGRDGNVFFAFDEWRNERDLFEIVKAGSIEKVTMPDGSKFSGLQLTVVSDTRAVYATHFGTQDRKILNALLWRPLE